MTTETLNIIAFIILWVYPTISTLAYYFIISDGLRVENENNERTIFSYIWRIVVSMIPIINMMSVGCRIMKASLSFSNDMKSYSCGYIYYSGYESWTPFSKRYWENINTWYYDDVDSGESFYKYSGGIDIKIIAFPLAVIFFILGGLIRLLCSEI